MTIWYLNEVVGLHVDGRRRLVQDEQLRFAEEGSRETDKLPLPHAQVLAALVDGVVESPGKVGNVGAEVGVVEGAPDVPVAVRGKGVQVHPHRAGEEDGILRDDGDSGAELPQPQEPDVLAVDVNGTACGFDYPGIWGKFKVSGGKG